jgi:peptidyl-prolyl cis-trans isomerase B (cyclophilin B)
MAQKKKMTKRRLAEIEKKAKAKKTKKIVIISVIIAVIVALAILIPVLVVNSKKVTKYYATVSVEGYGDINILLDKENAPKTAARFEKLASEGYYNGKSFFKFQNAMFYGGDGNGDGKDDYDVTIYGEFLKNGHLNKLSHDRGVISLYNDGKDYGSGASIFFITTEKKTELDGCYASFGKIDEEGMKIVDKMMAGILMDEEGFIIDEKEPKITGITLYSKKVLEK